MLTMNLSCESVVLKPRFWKCCTKSSGSIWDKWQSLEEGAAKSFSFAFC